MKSVIEFFFRMAGPVILISGIALFNTWYSTSSTYLSDTKQTYTKDNVYEEQASLNSADESVISRDELIAMLQTDPDKNIIIKDSKSGYTIKIHSGHAIDSSLKYSNGTMEKTIFFGIDRWKADGLDFDTWFQCDQYRSKPIVYTTGGIRRIYYEGIYS